MKCQQCGQPVDDEEAHTPSADECLEHDWVGDERWHATCCPYCSTGAGPLPDRGRWGQLVESFHPLNR